MLITTLDDERLKFNEVAIDLFRDSLRAALTHEAAKDAELKRLREENEDIKDVLNDKRRLTKDLDIAMHGEEGAAKQASLCDLIRPAERLRARIEVLEKVAAIAKERPNKMGPYFMIWMDKMDAALDALKEGKG
jgi:hypothetical protein